MSRHLRAWVEEHVGVEVEVRGQSFTLVGIEGGRAVLENEDERQVLVDAAALQQRFVVANREEEVVS
jgi:hypothetical protein